MYLPKIEFREMTLEENINFIKYIYFQNNDVLPLHDYTIECFPKLANIDNNLSKENIYKEIEKIVAEYYIKNKDRIKEETKRYNILWEKYNDKYFEELSIYLNVDWPRNIDKIIGTVGLMPVSPRYLDDFSFSVNIGIKDEQIIELCAHETLHFLWFEKWKEMYPKTPKYEYEAPYLVWQYSEMVTDPVLNNKPFKEIFDFTECGYDSFYELEDGDTKVMDNLRKIYSKNIPIEEKITIGFEYINKILIKEEETKRTKK